MNNISKPIASNTRPPTFTAPLFVKTSQSRCSFSFGSGLCNQSSFSTSSGNSNSPPFGTMLYFSDTVCVFKSSSLPIREGALESSNGDAKGPYLESRLVRLAADSELQLVRLEDKADAERRGDSSRKARTRVFFGGNSSSADSATPAFSYSDEVEAGERRPCAMPAAAICEGGMSERGLFERDELGRCASELVKASCVPEFRRICGGAFPRGDAMWAGASASGDVDDMASERMGSDN